MGKQPEPEDQSDAPPEHALDAPDADVEIEAELDLALRCEAAVPFEDVEATPLAMCQICMDFFGSKEVVRSICGPACLAEVCSECLVQHLTASVYSYYPGVLPKMRCPVCLVALNKQQWKQYVVPIQPTEETTEQQHEEEEGEQAPINEQNVGEDDNANDEDHDEATSTDGEEAVEYQQQIDEDDDWEMDNSHVVEKYEVLCHQSCGFQAPCCHNTEYSMLSRVDESQVEERVSVKLPTSQAAHLPQLSALFKDYCFHRVEVAEIYDFITEKFGGNAEDMLEIVLSNIADDERRAHLLLLHLFHNPDTYTTCCDYNVCFKCKTADHHNGNCGDFEVDENVLDCPGCRVTLVKVDGCDSVTCLCGYTIEWPVEMQKQRFQRKQLAPTDNKEYSHWRVWSYGMDACLNAIEELETTLRRQRLQRMLKQHRVVLQQLVDRAVRRARLNILIREHRERLRPLVRAHLERRKASMDQTLVKQTSSQSCGDAVGLRIAPAA